MKTLLKLQVFMVVSLLGIGFTSSLQAGYIYSNSINDQVIRFDPGTLEVGDEISFAGTERNLTYFDFEYWGANTLSLSSFAGNVQARVRFYENNGAPFNGYPRPSVTPFFDSGWFGGFGPTDYDPFRATIYFTEGTDFPSGGLFIPADHITWSVQFQGLGATDTVGVDLYSPPVIGGNFDDYWENGTGGWRLLTNSVPMDFGARFYAVPEPSSLVLSLAGGLGILILVRRLRRAE
jgi:hypothetical protein